jgi:hypothetical protein
MNAISPLGKFVQMQIVCLRIRLVALLLFHDYNANPSLTEFTAIDGMNFTNILEIH